MTPAPTTATRVTRRSGRREGGACSPPRARSAAPSRRPAASPRPASTTIGPSESAKSRLFAPGRSGASHSTKGVKPPIAPSAPMIAACRRRGRSSQRREARRRRRRLRGSRPGSRSAKSSPVEDPDGRRMEDRRAKDDLRERVLGVLARLAAAGEERLQRLRRELDDPVAVDPPRPAALEQRDRAGENMQSFTRSAPCGRCTSAISGSSRRIRSSISLARACASASACRGAEPQREVGDETLVGVEEAQLARGRAASPRGRSARRPSRVAGDLAPAPPSPRPAARGASARRSTSGTAVADRALDLLGDRVRLRRARGRREA